MSNWQDCVVTLVDVIGIKDLAQQEGATASTKMRKLHSLVRKHMKDGMASHKCCYCWNDSILLLAMWDGEPSSGLRILKDVSDLKKRIDDEIGKSYAISIKGRAFPSESNPEGDTLRCIVLRSSSYAMGNCFQVEARARKRPLKTDWYIDSRLRKPVEEAGIKIKGSFLMKLLPKQEARKILQIDGYIMSCAENSVGR